MTKPTMTAINSSDFLSIFGGGVSAAAFKKARKKSAGKFKKVVKRRAGAAKRKAVTRRIAAKRKAAG